MALVNPHGGGSLRPLLLEGEALKAELARAASLPKVKVSSREKGDIVMMGQGGFTPLDGFMSHADWQGVCDGMKMASGPVLADPDHAIHRQGHRRGHQGCRRRGADRSG
jgi:sulfate adenylyltransferase